MTIDCPIDVGTEIEMAFNGGDASIEICSIPDQQPYAEIDGMWLIVDQYGEEHMVQLDADTWVTATTRDLSDEGLERWVELNERAKARMG